MSQKSYETKYLIFESGILEILEIWHCNERLVGMYKKKS